MTDDEQRQLEHARRALVAELQERVPATRVEQRFDELVRSFDGAPVRTFVPVLVGRQVRAELRSG
jgi:hypothetical protein